MKKILLAIFLLTFLILPNNVNAQYVVPPVTERQITEIFINKLVQNPQNGLFVDNLGINDSQFLPGQEVNFKIEVTNNGETEINNISVKDQLPSTLDFVSGPGTFDSASRTINFSIDRLNSGETKSFEVIGIVSNSNDITNNQVVCVTNFAEARVNELFDQDTASLCIGSQVLAVTSELPKTGPNRAKIVFISSITLLILSVFLFKRFRNI